MANVAATGGNRQRCLVTVPLLTWNMQVDIGRHQRRATGRLPKLAAELHIERAMRRETHRYLVDPASSHMLVSKIKPCMSKYMPY